MADSFAGLGHSLDTLSDHLGIHGVHGLDVGLYILFGTVFLWLCAAVSTAIRAAFFRRSCEAMRRPAPGFHYRLRHNFSKAAALYRRWKLHLNEALI
jgi:hypothetical protein